VKAPPGYAIDVFVEFPCNGSTGVRVDRVDSEEAARKVARRFGYAVTTWKLVDTRGANSHGRT
jgi:hypothetical protein